MAHLLLFFAVIPAELWIDAVTKRLILSSRVAFFRNWRHAVAEKVEWVCVGVRLALSERTRSLICRPQDAVLLSNKTWVHE